MLVKGQRNDAQPASVRPDSAGFERIRLARVLASRGPCLRPRTASVHDATAGERRHRFACRSIGTLWAPRERCGEPG